MTTFIFDTNVCPDEYDGFVTKQSTCSLLQSAKWAKVKDNWDSKLTALRASDGTILAAALVLIRPIRFGYTMWYLPHGPVLNDLLPHGFAALENDSEVKNHSDALLPSDTAVLGDFLLQLSTEARKTKCVVIKVDPPIPVEASPLDSFSNCPSLESLAFRDLFEKYGYQHQGFTKHMHDTIQPRSFAVVPAPTHSTYEASLPKRTRTFARNARNRYVQTRRGTLADLDEFMSVINATEETKGIRLRDKSYFRHLIETYGDDAHLNLAYIRINEARAAYEQTLQDTLAQLEQFSEGSPKKVKALTDEAARLRTRIAELKERQKVDGDYATLAGCLLIRYGKTGELLYAGTNRNFGNITAQELMWVEALEEEFGTGASWVSLGGIANSHDDSLTSFKARFNPIIVDKLGEFDYPIHKAMYRVLRWVLARR